MTNGTNQGGIMKLHQLQYFREVCRQHSITKAAEVLHISQPAVSASIRELEDEFGLMLFNRSRKNLILTKEGSYFLLEVEDLLRKAEQIGEDMNRLKKKSTDIRLGLPPMIGALSVPLLASFSKEYPDIQIELTSSSSLSLRRALQEERLDVIIVNGADPDGDNPECIPLRRSEIVYCVNPRHPFAQEKTLPLVKTALEPWVEIKESFHFREQILQQYQEAGCTPRLLWTTDQLYTKIQIIKSGMANGFLYREIAEKEPDLVPISLDPPMLYDIEMIWRKNTAAYDSVNAFLTYAKEHF